MGGLEPAYPKANVTSDSDLMVLEVFGYPCKISQKAWVFV